MPELSLDDVTLHYETEGSGPPLLLLAGMLSDSASWEPLVSLMSRHTVIRLDNRTTGRTVPWDAPVDVARMVRDALALMDHLEFKRFHIAGHSMGGLMGLEIAGTAPDRVASLTIMASGRVRMPRIAGIFDALVAVREAPEGERLWLRALYPFVFGPAFFEDPETADMAVEAALAYPHAQTLEAMKHQIDMFRNMRLVADLHKLTLPVQVLYGEEDILVPPTMAQPGFAPLPNLTEHWLKGAGHSVVWDATETVAGQLNAFTATNPI
ncbi:alpha/beta fold hydrolase [Sulfitobacter sp. JB4-11]|uniref:alpha/beta fold hydrolase n=1 Tax=Sulfitobacter rhodophyticola TaxID=3238304 RepID=UPI0035196B11